MAVARDNLTVAAYELSHAAPVAWETFLRTMTDYVTSAKDECIQSPLEMLPVAQGRAQHAAQLLELLQNCKTTTARIVTSRTK
jgi:hypothetical protein